jgi:putative ATP-binding cassette transporter
MDASERARNSENLASEISSEGGQVVYKDLSLRAPRGGHTLIRGLSVAIPHGKNMLVCGPDETARTALFRATAGLWNVSEGNVVRPNLEQILFVTERPYLPPSTLRELFMRPWVEDVPLDARNPEGSEFPELRILEALHMLRIDTIPKRFGGMDKHQTWESNLTLTEQQLLVIARLLVIRPLFAFLDKPTSALGPEQVTWVLALLKERGISYVNFEESDDNLGHYDMMLELEKNGLWCCSPLEEGQIVSKSYEIAV